MARQPRKNQSNNQSKNQSNNQSNNQSKNQSNDMNQNQNNNHERPQRHPKRNKETNMSNNHQPNKRAAEDAYIGVFMRRLALILWNRGLCRDQKDNDDIVGYATEWLFRNFDKLYAKYPNPATLASVSARHRAVEWFRRETRQGGPHQLDENGLPMAKVRLDEPVNPEGESDDDSTPKVELVPGAVDVADIYIEAEKAARLEQALVGILSPKQSQVFFPVRLGGRRVKDVAADLGIKQNTATKRLIEADRIVREVLANEPWRLLGR